MLHTELKRKEQARCDTIPSLRDQKEEERTQETKTRSKPKRGNPTFFEPEIHNPHSNRNTRPNHHQYHDPKPNKIGAT